MSVVLSEHLPLVATAHDGISKLRGLILQLAVMGKLVPQDSNEEPASELLKRNAKERARRIEQSTRRKAISASDITESTMPFLLPVGWEWSNIAELAEVIRGVSYEKSQASEIFRDGYVALIRGNNINATLNLDRLVYVPTTQVSAEQLIRRGDVVIAMSSGSAHLVGKAAQAELDLGYGFGAFCGLIRAYLTELHPYFGFFFQTPMYRNCVAGHGKGIGINNLQKGSLLAIACPVPPLAEQHRIVAKVDELMALCDRLEAEQSDAESAHVQLVESLLRTLTQSTDAADLASNWQRIAEHFDTLFSTELSIDAFKGSVLQLAVMGRLVPQDPNDEPAEELLKHIQSGVSKPEVKAIRNKLKALRSTADDEVPFDIPGSWKWIRLSQLEPEYQNGESSRGAGAGVEMVVLRLADISSGELSLTHTRSMILPESSVEKYRLRKNDILVIRVNGSADIVGRLVLCDNNLDAIYCDHFIRLQFREAAIAHRYLRMLGDSPLVRNQIAKLFVSTAGQKTVNQGHIGGLRMPLPPLPEQHRIVAKVDELMALCDQMKADLREARAQQSRLADTLIGERFQ